MTAQPVLVNGEWTPSQSSGAFQADNPVTKRKTGVEYPASTWADCDSALTAAAAAARELARMPVERVASFLEAYADGIDARADEICQRAHEETALPVEPRLLKVELPRTTNQLRLAAKAARKGDWRMATIDTAAGIRSILDPIGPVCVFGPNNFPLAFNGISGGDFAAAIAAGNPVIAKANPSHPGTTELLGQEAHKAAQHAELPRGTVQLLYRTSHADGERLVSDPRVGAVAYTGSRSAGLKLKEAADKAGTPIYLELSSVNPVVLLPGAVASRGEELVNELVGSCLMGTGQFCTSPNLVVLLAGEATDKFTEAFTAKMAETGDGTLLSAGVLRTLEESVAALIGAGAEMLVGGSPAENGGYSFQNTALRVSGEKFLENPHALQTEAFGNATTLVVAKDLEQAQRVLGEVEGSLTGCVYSATDGSDDAAYDALAPTLIERVGRMLNDKMPTGVAVSSAMNHGGPFPATGHPGWTAVGIPAALRRFGKLTCYDNVRPKRLPKELADKNPNGAMWRYIDGEWSQGAVA